MPQVVNRGEGSSKPSVSVGAAYPCVRRLRHRRVLNFLRVQGLDAAFASMAGETDACFSVGHLQRLVERGRWNDAVGYLSRFVPQEFGRLGLEAQVLHRFLIAHMFLAHIIAGTREGDALAARYSECLNRGSSALHGVTRIRTIMLTALYAKQKLRTSIDWERVRRKASEIVNHLAYRTPELKGMVLMPSGLLKGHDVHSIRSSPRRRRYHGKKQSCRPRVSILVKSYLRKRSLLSSSHPQESHDDLLNKAFNWVADAIDECLKAGKRPELHQKNTLHTSVMKGATAAPISQATFGTSANPALNSGVLPASNAGGAFFGTMRGAPVSRAVFGTLSGHCKNSGMVMTNAAVRVAPVLQSMNLANHAEISGVGVAPVSQTIPSPFSCAAQVTGMPSVANAGATAPPVSQAAFGTIAGCPAINPGMPSDKNAGTNKYFSQDDCNAKSTHHSINPRKNQGEGLTTDEVED